LIYEGLSQVAADGVLAGAGTIRGGDIVFSVWHPELVRLRAALGRPRFPTQIIATQRGLRLDDHLLFNIPDIPAVVLTVPAGAERMKSDLARRPWVSAIVMTEPDDLVTAFLALRERGIERISAVGGRHLARQLIDAGLVQELYLTTAARPGGQPGSPLYDRPLPTETRLRKRGTGRDRGVTFEHLALRVRAHRIGNQTAVVPPVAAARPQRNDGI
jgi:riboflavin biosynthesis pyrimidine reductase